MILQVDPVRELKGSIFLPASKSYSIRAFIVAACGGISRIIHPSDCDDARVALNAARVLGARVRRVAPQTWDVIAGARRSRSPVVPVGESGTVLRFLLPLLAVRGRPADIAGQGTLIGRPNQHLTAVLRSRGVDIRGTGAAESVPICLRGGRLRGGRIRINGSLSSQFISALLIACPLLADDTTIEIAGKQVVSADYIAMTSLVLGQSGVKVHRRSERRYEIAGGQVFRGLETFPVPADYGLAAFMIAAGLLTDSPLVFKGYFNRAWVQADGRIIDFLGRMGVEVKIGPGTLRWSRRGPLKGGDFSLKNCPDLVPVMAVLALFATGRTRLKDIRHARVKESNRITDLRIELEKVGAHIRETADTLTIEPRPEYRRDVNLDPHRDHRLAMAFAVLGLKLGVRVKDMECVSKSYPGFIRDLKALGARVKRAGPRG